MKTHNTVCINIEGLGILVTAQSFSIDGGREWHSRLDGISPTKHDAISAAMREAARRDACDPDILGYRCRPTTKSLRACRDTVADRTDDNDEGETLRPELSQDLIPTVVPPYGGAPRLGERDEDDPSEVPTERPAVTEPVRSQECPIAGAQARPPVKKVSTKNSRRSTQRQLQ